MIGRSRPFIAGALALAFTLVGATALAAPRSAAPEVHVEDLRLASGPASLAPAASPGACSDTAYSLAGGRWRSTYEWSLRIGSTPSELNRSAVEAAVRKGVSNIPRANNDCGRADGVAARQRYLGTTTRRPSCRTRDGYNVIGFRALPEGTAARACWWTLDGRIIEADIQVSNSTPWATTLAGCRDQLMLEAVVTHEAGHAFGLGHVGERRHGRLTMSTYLDGPCQNSESTLGLGDMLALERLYP